MNKIIRVRRLSTPRDALKSIKFILDQLERYNYAYTNDSRAARLFSRFCREVKPKILVTKGDGRHVKSIITVHQDYYIQRVDDYSFKLRIRQRKVKKHRAR